MTFTKYSLEGPLLAGLMLLLVQIGFSQKQIKTLDPRAHHEVSDDPYVARSVLELKKSPAYRERGSFYFTNQVNVDEGGFNIEGDAANEPSIAVDPTNPDRMAIGWRQFDDVSNNFRQAGYGYTLDGGETWTFPGVIEPGIFRSDPVLGSDADGNFYYNSLTVDNQDNFWCDVFIIEEGGVEWDEGRFAQGGDKQWMAIDQTEGIGQGNNYSNWTSYYSICEPGYFTRSADNGETFEDCITISGTPFWGTLATGPEGELYVAGYSNIAGGFIISKSVNAQDPDAMITWGGFNEVDLGGYIENGEGPNPGGLLGQTWVAVDKSGGEYNGNVYMLCSVNRQFIGDPLDVMFARSTDGGETWSEPVRVNDDLSTNNWQWFGTMSVAPNGRIDVVWLDTRDAFPGSFNSSLYYSYSIDAGETFSPNERLSDLFDPHVGWPQQNKMGDYFHMVSDECCAHLAWANTLNGEQDVYYTQINPWFVGVDETNQKNENIYIESYPNPTTGLISIRYKTLGKGAVSVKLYDVYGKIIKTLVAGTQGAGSFTLKFDGSYLPDGIYYCRLVSGSMSDVTKITIVK
jgi:hypothetical protein